MNEHEKYEKCLVCGGDGWIADHSPEHYHFGNSMTCYEAGCPVQVMCDRCDGKGYIDGSEKYFSFATDKRPNGNDGGG